MSGLFGDFDKNKTMILGAFKKLKLYFYYDKTQLYNKAKLSVWENNQAAMDEKVAALATFMQSLESDVDYGYFNELVKDIGFLVFPKAFSDNREKNIGDHLIVTNVPDTNRPLSKANFFIQAPVEILILDMIWTLFIGKIAFDNKSISECAYANKLNNYTIFRNSNNLFEGIDFNSNRAFYPYFDQYATWRDKSIRTLKERHTSGKDSVLISLDIKSYYYSVKFKFDSLSKLLNNDARLDGITRLTELIEVVYANYTLELKNFRGKILASTEEREYVFPIGLISCMLVANLYLSEFDKKINQLSPAYYGRYVDDIILIIDSTGFKDQQINQTSIIHEILVKNNILRPIAEKEYSTIIPDGLILQKDKMRCFYYSHKESSSMIDLMIEKCTARVSEDNLLPDIDFDIRLSKNSFDSSVYFMDELNGTMKIRDFFISSNNYKAIQFINNLIRASKNIDISTADNSQYIEKQLEQIMIFYSGVQGVEYRSAWINIFSLAIVYNRIEFIAQFYNNMVASINSISATKIEDIDHNKLENILVRMRKDLIDLLKVAVSTVLAINSDDEIYKFLYDKNEDFIAIQKIAKDIRNANMFNNHLVSYPLINFLNIVSQNKLSYLERNLEIISSSISKEMSYLEFLDKRKIEFSPRFIHASEVFTIYFIFRFHTGGNVFEAVCNDLLKIFYQINQIHDDPIEIEYNSKDKEVSKHKIIVYSNKKGMRSQKSVLKIALANIHIDEFEDALPVLKNPSLGCTIDKKREIFKLLNEAAKNNVDIIVFPEYYFPIALIDVVCSFSKNST